MGVWRETGYADFADGEFGNGGQNLYVSRSGVLQRIFRFDLNRDGYTDLVFVNSQDMNERPPVTVIRDPLGTGAILELPAGGAFWGAAGDLNNDGFDDIVIANQQNGVHEDVTAFVYYGGPAGLSERCRIELPAPNSRAVAVGDFNGDGRADIVFSSAGKLRVFYQQPHGFAAGEFLDLDFDATHMCAGDLDGDGFHDLYVRLAGGRPQVFWGGPDGLCATRFTRVGSPDGNSETLHASTPGRFSIPVTWIPKVVRLNGVPHLFRAAGDEAWFYPVLANRHLGAPLRFSCPNAVAAAAGDISGNGHDDVVIAVCSTPAAPETSRVFWNDGTGFRPDEAQLLPTQAARDVAVADLNGNGYADVVICQGRTDILCTTVSLVYAAAAAGLATAPREFVTHDAATVLVARTNSDPAPQLVFVNHEAGRVRGDVPTYVYYGSATGFAAARRAELPSWAAPIAACCDFNDDGWPDLLIGNCAENALDLDPGSFLYRGSEAGFDPDRMLVLPTLRCHGIAVGDFRRTGALDVAVGGLCNAELLVFRGTGTGLDTGDPQRVCMEPGWPDYVPRKGLDWVRHNYAGREYNDPRGLLAADFNNDGNLDIFAACYNSGRERDLHSFLYWGAPGGNFSVTRRSRFWTHSACGAMAADFNEDGWIDLAVANHKTYGNHAGSSVVWWNGPDGFSEQRRTFLPTLGPHGMLSVDPGNVRDRGPEEYYVSSPFQLPPGQRPAALRWEAEIQPKTWVRAQLRCAANPGALAAAPWQGPDPELDWFENGATVRWPTCPGGWVQYRLALGAVNGGNSPRLTAVELEYE